MIGLIKKKLEERRESKKLEERLNNEYYKAEFVCYVCNDKGFCRAFAFNAEKTKIKDLLTEQVAEIIEDKRRSYDGFWNAVHELYPNEEDLIYIDPYQWDRKSLFMRDVEVELLFKNDMGRAFYHKDQNFSAFTYCYCAKYIGDYLSRNALNESHNF